MGAALAGLLVVAFCFKLILDADDILGDSNISVVEGSAEEARTTSLTPVGASPALDAKREDKSLSEISRRIAVIAFTVGISAVIFGLAGCRCEDQLDLVSEEGPDLVPVVGVVL